MAEKIIDGVLFKSIPVSPEHLVSACGKVFSEKTNKMLSLKPAKNGYRTISYQTVSKQIRSLKVARAILMAFVGVPTTRMDACHNNGIRCDDRLENLRWGTVKENSSDRRLHGTEGDGERNVNAILTNLQVTSIKEKIVSGQKSSDIAKEFGVNVGVVKSIRQRASWTSVAPHLNDKMPSRKKYNGRTIRQECIARGISYDAVKFRLRSGWSVESAINTPIRKHALT